jgi:hypothetical protein
MSENDTPETEAPKVDEQPAPTTDPVEEKSTTDETFE